MNRHRPEWGRSLKPNWEKRGRRFLMGAALGLVLILGEAWLLAFWQWLSPPLQLIFAYLAEHPLAIVGGLIILVSGLYFFSGMSWLFRLKEFSKKVGRLVADNRGLAAIVVGIVLLVSLLLASNQHTWVVLPFTEGKLTSETVDGRRVASQFGAELNQVGAGNPTPVLIVWGLREPHTSGGNVLAQRELALTECDQILQGPGDYIAMQRISLSRVLGDTLVGSQGSSLDLGNLSVGPVSIPYRLFTQVLLKTLPTDYREFNGQINEHNDLMEISISSSNPPQNWRVTGPNDAFPEMVEFLSMRIALDLNPELVAFSEVNTLSDRELAFAMGNHAFRQKRYRRAWAFYELADRFAPLDEEVDAMLGLTHYHLHLEQPEQNPDRLEKALQIMRAAVEEDPAGENSVFRPYLACLYARNGQDQQAEVERSIFNQRLRALENERLEALKQLPTRGPGRQLAVAGETVLFVDEAGVITGTHEFVGDLRLQPTHHTPRQITLYNRTNLLFISPDGTVWRWTRPDSGAESTTPRSLISSYTLNGAQQISTSTGQSGRFNLFLLNRFGRVFWCDLSPDTNDSNSCSASRPKRQLDFETSTNIRQVFPMGDQLYLLASDGTVWHTVVDSGGRSSPPSQLTLPDQIREIFVTSDESNNHTVFLLHDNGNVWRLFDDNLADTEDLKLIDPGTGTTQIYAKNDRLYLLKSDGALWRISHARDPDLKSDFVRLELLGPLDQPKIQEILVDSQGTEDDAGALTVYLLTDQRRVLRGVDNGQTTITFSPVFTPNLSEPLALQ